MAIFTDYYKFERLATKSKSRMDCTTSTESYTELEEKRATKSINGTGKRDCTNIGDLVVYYNDVPPQFNGDAHRKADKSISIKGKNLSSIYIPELTSNIGYGDINKTTDAIIFVFTELKVVNGYIEQGAIIEMFIARGQSNNCIALYNLVSDGELEEEMNSLRELCK